MQGNEIKPIETTSDFIDDTERKILYEELPVLICYLRDLLALLQKSNDRAQQEALQRDSLTDEIQRMSLRVTTRVHQLMNLPYIKQLIEEHERKELCDGEK